MMMRPDQNRRYSHVAIALHWMIAISIIGQIALGFYMKTLPIGSMDQFTNFQLHKSVGISILLLTVVRLLWRLGHRPPPLPSHMKSWERAGAHISHWGLYGLMFLIPLSGWALVSASPLNFPTVLFGTVPWPHIPGLQGTPMAWYEGTHGLAALLMIALIVLHAGAALRHHFILKDGVLLRMIPWRSKT